MKLPRAHHITVEELVGQMLIPAVQVDFLNRHSPLAKRFLRLVQKYHIGGVVLFGGHPADVQYWTNRLQEAAPYPLLVAADLERGVGGLFSHGTTLPHALAWGAADDPELIDSAAEVIAREARAMGINTVFAPVLDLVNEPDNPIINIRGFHYRPEKVAELGVRFLLKMQDEGMACVGKHFPGHGRAQTDSHLELPRISAGIEQLQNADLLPFREAVTAGVQGIMTAHLRLADADLPVTLNRELLHDLLRVQMGFTGVLFSDALMMYAISRNFSAAQIARLGVEAGLDVFLMPENLPLLFRILTDLAREETQLRRQMEQSVERIFRLKKWLHSRQPGHHHPGQLYKYIEQPQSVGIARQLAEQGVTCVHRNEKFPLHLPSVQQCVHIIHTDFEIKEPPLIHFSERLEQFFDSATHYINPSEKAVRWEEPNAPQLIIFSLYSRTFAWHQSRFHWDKINSTLQSCLNSGVPVVVLVFGNPFHLRGLKDWQKTAAVFLFYSYVEASQNAAFRTICSFIPVKGNLPIRLEISGKEIFPLRVEAKNYRLQSDPEQFISLPEAETLIQNAIAEEIFPGGVLLVVQKGEVKYWQGFGRFDYDKNAIEVRANTVYDLASLTKVLATAPAILKLTDDGKIRLNQPLADFYPELAGEPLGQATIADLLAHQSGLPAWKPLYRECRNREEVIRAILRTPLKYPTGRQCVYSDLGFILLGDIVERVSGLQLDTYCRDLIFQPLGLESLHFRPVTENHLSETKRSLRLYPPTGWDEFRQRTVQGEVNDTNCYAMNGVAGHAGLFGNAPDVAAMGQLFLNNGIYNTSRLLKCRTARLAVQPYRPQISSRWLGWDAPTPDGSTGKYFSQESFGHLGFTGTSLWVDPQKELIVVFLSNRTHPDPAKNEMGEFRRELHNRVVKALLSVK